MDAMESYGRNLGIAFQIVDDLLDVLGDEVTTGKSLGSDLDQLKPTVPLIHVLEHVSADERDSVMSVLRGDRGQRNARLRPWLDRFGSLDYGRSRAQWYADQAQVAVASLPHSDA